MIAIKAAHKASRNIYGSPQVHLELVAQGHAIGRGRVARPMRDNALRGKCKRRFRTTTQSVRRHPIVPNVLVREFMVEQPKTALTLGALRMALDTCEPDAGLVHHPTVAVSMRLTMTERCSKPVASRAA